jgi:hypothetical protein
MHASITVSGMKDPPDLRNDLIGKQKRGRKRIHGRQARTNRYGVTVHKPAKKRKVNKEWFYTCNIERVSQVTPIFVERNLSREVFFRTKINSIFAPVSHLETNP